MNVFYVYAYLCKNKSTPYYIGKGRDNRAWSKHTNIQIPSDPTRIVILESNLTEIGALAIERRMIRWYGRKDKNTGILMNRTDGGDGLTDPSPQTRLKMSNAKKGKARTIETREKISRARKGTTMSVETRSRMSAAAIARTKSYSWWYNPETQISTRADVIPGEGWLRGRPSRQ